MAEMDTLQGREGKEMNRLLGLSHLHPSSCPCLCERPVFILAQCEILTLEDENSLKWVEDDYLACQVQYCPLCTNCQDRMRAAEG